jgi:hypothetical protein
MSKTASLGSGLIATKGKATPTSDSLNTTVSNIKAKRIAITVKLLEKPYERMKAYGAMNHKSNQDILEQALNMYLDKVAKL